MDPLLVEKISRFDGTLPVDEYFTPSEIREMQEITASLQGTLLAWGKSVLETALPVVKVIVDSYTELFSRVMGQVVGTYAELFSSLEPYAEKYRRAEKYRNRRVGRRLPLRKPLPRHMGKRR